MVRDRQSRTWRVCLLAAGVLGGTLVFSAAPVAQADVTPPAVAIASPASAATGVATTSNVKATFSEEIQPETALHPNFPAVPYVYVLYAYDAFPGGTAPQWGVAGQVSYS
jgi:hypothetical protein